MIRGIHSYFDADMVTAKGVFVLKRKIVRNQPPPVLWAFISFNDEFTV
jgi:hypothetical protein